MKLFYNKAFRTPAGTIVTMKSVITMRYPGTPERTTVQVNENADNYPPEELEPLTPEEEKAWKEFYTNIG